MKPHNFGFNENNEIVLFDFGMAISVQSRAIYSMEVKGTFRYMAPEVGLLGQPEAIEKVDMYSFSLIVWEMVTDEFPYASISKMDFIDVFLGGAMDVALS